MADNFFKIAKGVTLKSQSSTPSNPQNGDMYYDSTLNKFRKYENGSWGDFAGGAGGGINYLQTISQGDMTTGFVVSKNTTPAIIPDTGFVTSGTNITITSSSSSPLRSVNSLVITKDAVNRQGEQVYYDFSIDSADQAKMLQFSMDYNIASGTYADDDLIAYIYDVTNAVLIQPVPYKIKKHTLASERFTFEFQTAYNSTSYRLIFHVSSTSASAYSLKFDNLSLGPNVRGVGSVVTDWQAATVTCNLTNQTTLAKKRRVGDSMEYLINTSCTGTPATADAVWTIAETIDAAKLGAGSFSNLESLGIMQVYDASTAVRYIGAISVNNSTSVRADTHGLSTIVSNTSPVTLVINDQIELHFIVPVLGLSASSQIIDDGYAGRVVAASASGNPASATSGNPIIFPTSDIDTVNGYSASTGQYTVKTEGYYKVGISGNNAIASALSVYLYKNAILNQLLTSISTTDIGFSGQTIVQANAGDLLDVRPNNTFDVDGGNITFERIPGSPQVLASEKVSFSYTQTSGQALTGGVGATVVANVKKWDSHGIYNTSTGKFKLPRAGVGSLKARFLTSSLAAGTSNYYGQLQVLKNGSPYKIFSGRFNVGAGTTTYAIGEGPCDVEGVAGDEFEVQAYYAVSTNINMDSTQNFIDFTMG